MPEHPGGDQGDRMAADVDAVLSEAKAQGRHVLLDFSAAPM